MKKILLISVAMSCMMLIGSNSYGQFWKKKKKVEKAKTEKKEKNAYKELFKDKKFKTYKGLITIHKFEKDNKIYFEFPLSLLNKDMLLASTISETSDNGNSLVGQKPHKPLHIKWKKENNTLQMCLPTTGLITDEPNIERAIKKSNIDAIFKSFKIKAYSKDSTSIVADVTKLFTSNIKDIDPFDPYGSNTYGGQVKVNSSFIAENSYIKSVKSFEDNICITSTMTYTISRSYGPISLGGGKFTANISRSMILLPENPMRSRLGDPRIGIFLTYTNSYSKETDAVTLGGFANRWRLEPKDMDAWKRGELVEPKKPVVYYIDNNYPQAWKKYVKLGVEDWNDAFEKIGFKNAIIAKPFPTKEEDPEFDPDNIKYSCLRYAPSGIQNSMGPSWVDPRTGEIINASVYSYHNVAKILNTWLIIQTAAVDKNVRKVKLDEKTFGKTLRYVIAHEVGHTLGLMHNMSASAAIPTDSLRSPSFTQKYGTTYSIMDYARFNYVAQPGDKEKGVNLMPPKLGLYDYYAIKWLYSPIPKAKNSKEEVTTLNRWINEKSGNPIYRYGKQQFDVLDPSSLTEDLGDDAVKSSYYGIKNLKYLLKNLNEWFADQDLNRLKRNELYIEVLNQYRRYMMHVFRNIAGVYVNETYENDKLEPYRAVPRDVQKKCVKYIMKMVYDYKWLAYPETVKSVDLPHFLPLTLRDGLFTGLLNRSGYIDRTAYRTKPGEKKYLLEEYLDDIASFTFKNKNKFNLNKDEISIQKLYVNHLIKGVNNKLPKTLEFLPTHHYAFNYPSEIEKRIKEMGSLESMDYEYNNHGETNGFNWGRSIGSTMEDDTYIYYNHLMKAKNIIKARIKNSKGYTKSHYQYLLLTIDKKCFKEEQGKARR